MLFVCSAALSSASEVKLLMKEIVKMVNFDHPNVMTLTGVILVEGGAPLLVMPYMVKGTLLTYVRENKDQFFVEDESENLHQVGITLLVSIEGVRARVSQPSIYNSCRFLFYKDI